MTDTLIGKTKNLLNALSPDEVALITVHMAAGEESIKLARGVSDSYRKAWDEAADELQRLNELSPCGGAQGDTSEISNDWEYFCDHCYYDQWAVREKGEMRWGHCFHVPTIEEAKGLVEVLNTKSLKDKI